MSLFDDLPDPVCASGCPESNLDPQDAPKSPSGNSSSSSSKRPAPQDDTEASSPVTPGKAARLECAQEAAPLLHTCATVAARRGERPDMQDAHVIEEQLPLDEALRQVHDLRRLSFYAVFDGHGGAAASRFAAERLRGALMQRLAAAGCRTVDALLDEGKRAFADAYRRVDEAFLKTASAARPPLKDGSTAATVLLVNDALLVANVGDTRAVLYRAAAEVATDEDEVLRPLLLTSEHSPAQYLERQRIQRAGGQVRNGRVSGVIEVSRSLGDAAFKRLGVVAAPDLRRCALSATRDRALVVACDGLWNCFSVEQVGCALATARLHAPGLSHTERRARQEKVCARLTADAVLKLSGDNVTLLLVTFV